jgi:hypothetical protein
MNLKTWSLEKIEDKLNLLNALSDDGEPFNANLLVDLEAELERRKAKPKKRTA